MGKARGHFAHTAQAGHMGQFVFLLLHLAQRFIEIFLLAFFLGDIAQHHHGTSGTSLVFDWGAREIDGGGSIFATGTRLLSSLRMMPSCRVRWSRV